MIGIRLVLLGLHTLDLSLTGMFAKGGSAIGERERALRTARRPIQFGAFGMHLPHSRFSFAAGAVPELLSLRWTEQ